MEKRWISSNTVLLVLLFGHLHFWGCSSFVTPKYPEPILLDSELHVNLRYEYDDVVVSVPVRIVEEQPTAYRLGIYHRDKIASPLFEQLYFPGDRIMVILPRNVFSTGDLSNLVVLTPLGGDFQPTEILFNLSPGDTTRLAEIPIRLTPGVITGTVLVRVDKSPVSGAVVSIIDSTGIISSTQTDSIGFYRIELESEYLTGRKLLLQVSTDGRFAEVNQQIEFPDKKELRQDILLGSSPEFLDQGMVYRVNRNLTPFRTGPENGAEIHFFLPQGEIFIVTKVAGDRLYGLVETINEEKGIREQTDGWVLRQYLELIP